MTPSQLYVFMPPNLGGFFMVRSYYPSECHADYFDFERIEALKPAIEACGISTLSQSPMLGFHKQMDNRIKLLEEILSFRMQGRSEERRVGKECMSRRQSDHEKKTLVAPHNAVPSGRSAFSPRAKVPLQAHGKSELSKNVTVRSNVY